MMRLVLLLAALLFAVQPSFPLQAQSDVEQLKAKIEILTTKIDALSVRLDRLEGIRQTDTPAITGSAKLTTPARSNSPKTGTLSGETTKSGQTIPTGLPLKAQPTAYIVGYYPAKNHRGLGGNAQLRINKKVVAKIGHPCHARVAVPPSSYEVTMGNKPRPPIICKLEAGETCYIRYEFVSLLGSVAVVQKVTDARAAEEELSHTRPAEAKKVYGYPGR